MALFVLFNSSALGMDSSMNVDLYLNKRKINIRFIIAITIIIGNDTTQHSGIIFELLFMNQCFFLIRSSIEINVRFD